VPLLEALGASLDPEAARATPEALGIGRVAFFAIALLPFVFVFLLLWGCLRVLHQRPLRSLVAPGRVDLERIVWAGGTWGGLMVATALATLAVTPPGDYRFVFEPGPFFQLLALALLLIPIQAGTEELLVRGYMMQGLARWLRTGWIALVATSVLFGALHGANTEVAVHGALLTMPYYMGFGLLMGSLTLVDDGLEMALGIHVANNLFGTVLVTSPESSLPTPALLQTQTTALSASSFLLWVATAAVFVGLAARRYGWTWADVTRALGTVEPPGDASPSSWVDPSSRANQEESRSAPPDDAGSTGTHRAGS
jgi:membrane protease YdiL (CAAX protease family)